MNQNAYFQVVGMMPSTAAEQLSHIDPTVAACATEIRLRAEKPCMVYANGKPYFIRQKEQPDAPVSFGQSDIKDILAHMCEYALYKKEDELNHGYLTIKGGHRVGVCSTYLQNGNVDVGAISSVSIRIAREHKGCAADVFGHTMRRQLCSVLIAGPPLCGKTTILRDLARILASRPLYKKVAIIDERGELASVCGGAAALDTGLCSDILDGYPRPLGFDIAVRTLSPDYIVCDELGSDDDCASITNASKSGICVLASAHARDRHDLLEKAAIRQCVDSGVFDSIVFLEQHPNIGSIRSVYEVKKQ